MGARVTARAGSPSAAGALAVATLLLLAGCAAGAPGESAPPASVSPVDWLLDGAGAEALGDVPGSRWPPDTPLIVNPVCGPTDEHEGWTLSASVVAGGDTGKDFDGGDDFELAHTNGRRVWRHVGDQRLRLVEQEDGRVDVEVFVARDDAPDWEAVDRVEVEAGPERCG